MATSTPSPPPPPPSLPPSPPPPPPLSSPQPPLSPPPPPQPPSSPTPPLDPDETHPIPNREDQPGSSVAPPSSPSTQSLSPPQTTAAEQNPSPEVEILEAAPIQAPPPPPPPQNKTKSQSLPWTHQETANLILAYQEKWYSLKKGQLKASQWEEVAITVAARCNYDEPTKSATQCRHKIEKLRKRYREEKGKPMARGSAWNFFKLMDNLERGPLPISASPPIPVGLLEYPDSANSSSDSDFQVKKNKKKKSSGKPKSADQVVVRRGLRTPTLVRKREEFEFSDEEEGNGGDERRLSVPARLAAEVSAFADRFLRMEGKKIEMMRDTVRYRMEMEKKKMEMILENQQKLVEIVHKAFNNTQCKKLRV